MTAMDIIAFTLVGLSFAISYLNYKWPQPLLSILNRWMRWLLFALLFTFIVNGLPEVPSWNMLPHVGAGLLVYLLLETVYNWLAIGALSKSELPLFPTFRPNHQGDEWPAHKKFHVAKEWLRDNHFTRSQSIKAELAENLFLRSSIYDEPERQIRLQILFIPQRTGNLGMCYIFSSVTESGQRIITDNVFMPFGGFYPENWEMVRKPVVRSLEKLLNIHRSRLAKASDPMVCWDDEPLKDLNHQQRELERLNMRMGFLTPPDQQEDLGKISEDGRYRIWKEVWMLNYLGISSL